MVNKDFSDFYKSSMFIYEHWYLHKEMSQENDPDEFAFITDSQGTSVIEKEDFEADTRSFLNYLYESIKDKKVIVTWGVYSLGQFEHWIEDYEQEFKHLDLMQCYMNIFKTECYLSLEEVFEHYVSENMDKEKFADIFKTYYEFHSKMNLIFNRIDAIEYLFNLMLSFEVDFLPTWLLVDIEKHKLEQLINNDEIEDKKRRL
ncbi:hypothetical protein EF297_004981 [Escherichia coli]|nr:hypothetical protein [Escherichia coli]EEW0563753.1 hypothetical protein [Escherichia coli]